MSRTAHALLLLIALLGAGPSSAGTRVGGISFPGAPRAGASAPSSLRTHWGNLACGLGLAAVPGQYHDRETDLFENWNRFYDPNTGRYLGPEPKAYEPGYLLAEAGSGRNVPVYAYAGNNPVNFTDPDGLEIIDKVVNGGEKIKNPTDCGPDKDGCTADQTKVEICTACADRDKDGSYEFDVKVTTTLETQYKDNSTKGSPSAESPGLTVGGHEGLHYSDMQKVVEGLNGEIQTEGFSTRESCKKARSEVIKRISEKINAGREGSHQLRDLQGKTTP